MKSILAWTLGCALSGLVGGYVLGNSRDDGSVRTYIGSSSVPIPPVVGTKAQLPNQDSFGKPLPTGVFGLVVAGNCYACSASNFDPVQAFKDAKVPVVAIYWLFESELSKEAASMQAKGNIFCDPNQLLLPIEFRYRVPSAYLIDGKTLRVLRVQESEQSINDFLSEGHI